MSQTSAAQAAEALPLLEGDLLRSSVSEGAVVVDLDDVAQRRERLAAYVQATRPVIVYRFLIPKGATVRAFGPSGEPRDAQAQLELMVGLTGGGLAKSPAGVAVRIPKALAPKFETMAGPLIGAYLVSLELDCGA